MPAEQYSANDTATVDEITETAAAPETVQSDADEETVFLRYDEPDLSFQDDSVFHCDLARVFRIDEINGEKVLKWNFMDRDGNIVFDEDFDQERHFGAYGLTSVCKDGKLAVMNLRGEYITDFDDDLQLCRTRWYETSVSTPEAFWVSDCDSGKYCIKKTKKEMLSPTIAIKTLFLTMSSDL